MALRNSKAAAGPFGDAEEDAFKRLHREPSPSHLIHEAYFTLMSKLVPSVLEKDAEAFEEALIRARARREKVNSQVSTHTTISLNISKS